MIYMPNMEKLTPELKNTASETEDIYTGDRGLIITSDYEPISLRRGWLKLLLNRKLLARVTILVAKEKFFIKI